VAGADVETEATEGKYEAVEGDGVEAGAAGGYGNRAYTSIECG
jgi:hypothetical protein